MKTRIITAAVGLGVLAVVLAFFDTFLFDLVLSAVCLIAIHEVFSAMGFGKKQWYLYAAAVPLTLLVMLSTLQMVRGLLLPAAFLTVLFYNVCQIAHVKTLDFGKLTGFVYFSGVITFCFYSLIHLKRMLPFAEYRYDAIYFILLILCFAWGGDTAAYFAGRAFGRHKLAPIVSPHKTVEGAVGGVLGGSLLQKPTIPVMLLSTFVAGLESVFIQHVALGDVLKATVNGFDVSMIHRAGFDTETCSEAVTKLLNRGGMNGIMSTTLLVFCAFCFAGIMSRAGCLDVVLQKILSVAKSTGALITATVAACITMALTTGNSYLSILIPGEMFRDAYKERGLAAKNLSRTLEDAGTVVVPLIPWSAAGAYMASTLGVETLDYLPWAILCYTGWIFAIIWGFTGFGIAKLADEKKKEN